MATGEATIVVRNDHGIARVEVDAQDCENPPTAEQIERIRRIAQQEMDANPHLYASRWMPIEDSKVREFVEEVRGRVLGLKTPTYDPPPRKDRSSCEWTFRDKLKAEKAKRKRKRRRS